MSTLLNSSNEFNSWDVSIGTSVGIVGILRLRSRGVERTILLLLLRAILLRLSVIFLLFLDLIVSFLAEDFGGGTSFPTVICFLRVVLLAATSRLWSMGLLIELLAESIELEPSSGSG